MLKTQLCLTVSKSILTCWATTSNLFWSSVTPYILFLQCCRCFSHLAVVSWKSDMQLICGINFGHPHTSGDARPVCRSISNAVFTNISAAVILNFLYPYFGSCERSSLLVKCALTWSRLIMKLNPQLLWHRFVFHSTTTSLDAVCEPTDWLYWDQCHTNPLFSQLLDVSKWLALFCNHRGCCNPPIALHKFNRIWSMQFRYSWFVLRRESTPHVFGANDHDFYTQFGFWYHD